MCFARLSWDVPQLSTRFEALEKCRDNMLIWCSKFLPWQNRAALRVLRYYFYAIEFFTN